jgi:hypothetical protein
MKYLLATFFLIASAFHGRNLWRWIKDGESYLVMSVSGDGVFGRPASRADEPVQFWFNVSLNSLVIAGFAIFGFCFFLDQRTSDA